MALNVLLGLLRWDSRSGYTREGLVGFKDAFAAMRRPDKPLLQGIEYSRERLVDLEAVFAGKPAPTGFVGYVGFVA